MELEKSPVVLPAGTLHAAVPEEGWKKERSPLGLWEGLKAGKQILDMVTTGSRILESRVGKEIHY